MKLKEFDIYLDIKKHNKLSIEVVQNDNETNVLNIFLIDGINQYEVNSSVEVAFLKPNGNIHIKDDSIVNSNKIKCILSSEILDTAGNMLSEVRLLKEDIIMTIGQIEIYVRKSIY